MQTNFETDVLVIGAGPAGSAAAIQLRNAGLNTVVIDKSAFPRHAPGETFHPGIEPLLERLGVEELIQALEPLRHHGINTIKNNQLFYSPYNETLNWRGFNLFREDFDQVLIDKAIELGVSFISSCKPKNICLNNAGEVTTVTCNKIEIAPKFIIDATGRRGWAAKNLNIEYEKHSPKLTSYYGYTSSPIINTAENPCFYCDQNGWTWTAKISEEQYTVVRLDTGRTKTKLEDSIPEQMNIEFQKKGGADVTWRIATKASDKNIFLVGDAAFVLDPGSSKGVIKSIMTGIAAAHLIAHTNQKSIQDIHIAYNSWVTDWFIKEKNELLKFYEKNGIDTSRFIGD